MIGFRKSFGKDPSCPQLRHAPPQQEDSEALTRETLLEATKVESVRMTLVTAEDHNCFKFPRWK
jgi:hypothetical protein